MTHYLIEFRFQGKAKSEIRQLSYHLDSKFHLNILKDKRPIPHISLAGPLTTTFEKRLINDFVSVCSKTPFCSFKINGYAFFDDSRVVYIRIDPSTKLKTFRWNLAQSIMPYCKLKNWDHAEDFAFHATLAMKLPQQKFERIKKYVSTLEPQKYKHFLIRATLIKNQKILCEYDFLQRRVLTRSEALNKRQASVDRNLLKQFFSHTYNPDDKLNQVTVIPDEIYIEPFWVKIIDFIRDLF